MYLKRLDVTGFKSFAGKTTVDFVPGVTGVVGPNGSGKSNITEAIRWVLGEQSARSLRGSKMEDIIFSGSDARGAVNMAEVTLTLDNSDRYLPLDYSEISVTRRVYRSGVSEFQLNGQNCRLKDIVDLFMDSGLGKEAYSVIGQGKIDEILNSKAEDKRKIFEEASGVLKYKLRKQSAERKLDESEDNLNRVEDILHELEERLGPLEAQAATAKDYLKKKATLEAVEVAVLVHDIERAHEEWERSKKRVAELSDQKKTLDRRITEQEERFRLVRAQTAALDREIESLQNRWALSGEHLEQLIGRKDVLAERSGHAQSSVMEMKQRTERIKQQLSRQQQELSDAKAGYRKECERLEVFQGRLKEKQNAFANLEQDLDEQIEQLKAEYIDVLNRQATLRNEYRYLNDQRESLAKKKSRILSGTEAIKEQLAAASRKRGQLLAEIKGKQTRRGALEQKINQCRAHQKTAKTQYNALAAVLEQLDREIGRAASKKETLEAMNEEYAGYYEGVKTVLRRRHELPGIKGSVAELIDVDSNYATAIEIALGAATQHIIVADEASGRQAIRFLRDRRAGRATFLPMTVMKARAIAAFDLNRLRGSKAFVGTADTLVRFDPAYRSVIGHLLGAIVVVTDLEGANRLARALGFKYRMVTLEGDSVAPGGSMTGGSLKQKRIGLIGRTGAIDALADKIRAAEEKKGQTAHRLSELKARLDEDEAEADRLEKSLAVVTDELRAMEARLQEAKAEEQVSREKHALLLRENDDFEKEEQSISERQKQIDRELTSENEHERDLKRKIEQLTKSRENRETLKEELRSEITELQVRTAEQGQITVHRKERVDQAAARVDEMKDSLDALLTSIRDMESDRQKQSADQARLKQEIRQMTQEKAQLSQLLEEKKRARKIGHEQAVEGERLLKASRTEYGARSEQLQKESIALERLDLELDHLLDALRETYALTFEAAKDKYPLKMDLIEARKTVKRMKRSISEMGTVNTGAIEEYRQVDERAQFLSRQRDDLLHARATLEHVMDEMDKEVIQRFSSTFKQIRTRFQTVFRELFGGGRADLRLTNPDDLLESGVEIFAEPPGKKLQRLSLLSGGERALTAIALLFAILKVRPVPFCVLDEVEAALDDANVDRYARYLKMFSRQTQFIVVTHRHGTMEHADVLYGITMQESGISKLVSVKLEETEALLSVGQTKSDVPSS